MYLAMSRAKLREEGFVGDAMTIIFLISRRTLGIVGSSLTYIDIRHIFPARHSEEPVVSKGDSQMHGFNLEFRVLIQSGNSLQEIETPHVKGSNLLRTYLFKETAGE